MNEDERLMLLQLFLVHLENQCPDDLIAVEARIRELGCDPEDVVRVVHHHLQTAITEVAEEEVKKRKQ